MKSNPALQNQIVALLTCNPKWSNSRIAAEVGVSRWTILRERRRNPISLSRGRMGRDGKWWHGRREAASSLPRLTKTAAGAIREMTELLRQDADGRTPLTTIRESVTALINAAAAFNEEAARRLQD